MELPQEYWIVFSILLAIVMTLGWLTLLTELILLRIAKRLAEGTWDAKRWFRDSVWISLLAAIFITILALFLAERPDVAKFAQEDRPERDYCALWLANVTVFWAKAIVFMAFCVVWLYGSLIIGFLFKQLPAQKKNI